MCSESWVIWYCVGCDESGDFLGYYAVRLMTTDHHLRLYEDGGRGEGLPAHGGWCPAL